MNVELLGIEDVARGSILRAQVRLARGLGEAEIGGAASARDFELLVETSNARIDPADAGNGLLAGALLLAMKAGEPISVEAAVSPTLMRAAGHAGRIQDIYHAWDAAYERVEVRGGEGAGGRTGAGVALFFSGGVDSFYSLLKHADEVTHLVFVHGFDIRLGDDALYRRVVAEVRKAAEESGKSLVEVRTNLRELSDRHAPWGTHYNGAALAAIGLFLGSTFRKVYVASSHTYAELFPWGSHPVLDHLWSTERTSFEHDGCEATRVEKVGRLAGSDVALRYLRVCFKNVDGEYNCGRCEKCLRTMINLSVYGALGRCRTFTRPLDLERVAAIRMKDTNTRSFVEENYRAVKAAGSDAALQKALRHALAKNHYRGFGKLRRLWWRVHWTLENRAESQWGRASGRVTKDDPGGAGVPGDAELHA